MLLRKNRKVKDGNLNLISWIIRAMQVTTFPLQNGCVAKHRTSLSVPCMFFVWGRRLSVLTWRFTELLLKSSTATWPLKFVLACTACLFVSLFKKNLSLLWNSRITFVIMPDEIGVYVGGSDRNTLLLV